MVDDSDILKDPVIGYMRMCLGDLLEARTADVERDWWPLSGRRGGRKLLRAEWKPLDMAGSLHGVDQYVPPIVLVRLRSECCLLPFFT